MSRPPAPDRLSAPVPISAAQITANFSCGEPALDAWLKERALTSEGRTARTYVVCAGATVVGYYSLATGSVDRDRLPKKLSGDVPASVPVILIGRLAVDTSRQGHGVGRGLLKDALSRSLQASVTVGCRAVMVHAKDERVAAFYRSHGFMPFAEGDGTHFIPMKTIAAAL